jgi:GntR family transcriptional regulator
MKLEIDHKSAIPLHVQTEQLLRKMIDMPEYQKGKLLPNEVTLSSKLGISRNTLRQATNKLVYEGQLIRKKGVGTIVSKPVNSKAKNWLSFSQEMREKGIKIVNYEIDLKWEVPPADVLHFFGFEEEVEML